MAEPKELIRIKKARYEMKEELKRKYESYIALRKERRIYTFVVLALVSSLTIGWVLVIITGLTGLAVLIVIIIVLIAILRKNPSPPIEPSENRMFLNLCDALRNMEYYFDDTTSNIHLDRARKNLDKLISSIKRLTPTSYSMIIKKAIHEPLQRLRSNLEKRILPLIRYPSSQKDVQQAYSTLQSLAFIFKEPTTIAQNLSICNEMLEGIPESKIEIISHGFSDSLSIFFSAHTILKHGLVASIIFIMCCVFYYFVVSYLEIQKEYVLGVSGGIFIGLLTIYFRRQPKE